MYLVLLFVFLGNSRSEPLFEFEIYLGLEPGI
jgi:hypothetical protein